MLTPDSLLKEYGLGEHDILRQALSELDPDVPRVEEAARTYLSERAKHGTDEKILLEIENSELRRLAVSVVIRQIHEIRARLHLAEAKQMYKRARNKKGMATEKLRKAVEGTCDLPAHTDWVIDADRGAIRKAPFDGDRVLLGLAFDLLRMDDSLLALVSEMKGELLPESMRARMDRLEESRPESQDVLVDLACAFRRLPQWLRQVLPQLVADKKIAQTLLEDDGVPRAIHSLARMRLEVPV